MTAVMAAVSSTGAGVEYGYPCEIMNSVQVELKNPFEIQTSKTFPKVVLQISQSPGVGAVAMVMSEAKLEQILPEHIPGIRVRPTHLPDAGHGDEVLNGAGGKGSAPETTKLSVIRVVQRFAASASTAVTRVPIGWVLASSPPAGSCAIMFSGTQLCGGFLLTVAGTGVVDAARSGAFSRMRQAL
jgi:hypothetical protein